MKKIRGLIGIWLLCILLQGCSDGRGEKWNSENYMEGSEITLELPAGPTSGIYTGEIKNEKPHGEGTFYTPNTKHPLWNYKGQWVDGKMQGNGKIEYSDGNTYEGEFMNSQLHGFGVCYADGKVLYKGSFEEGNLKERRREVVKIFNPEDSQYVQMGAMGFQIPSSWKYESESDDSILYILPEDDQVQITVLRGAYQVELDNSQVREELKESSMPDLGLPLKEQEVVSSSYEGGALCEYNVHYRAYVEGGNLPMDVYVRFFNIGGGSYEIVTLLADTNYDYSEDAACIMNTMRLWSAIEKELEETAREQKRKEIKTLQQNQAWEEVKEKVPAVSGEDFFAGNHKNEIIMLQGIISKIEEETFELWIPYKGSYIRTTNWKYKNCGLSLKGIAQGDTVSMVIETHEDGSQMSSDGIYGIHREETAAVDLAAVYKESCPDMDYTAIMRNPKDAYRTVCKAGGEVLQVLESSDTRQEFLLYLPEGRAVYVNYYKEAGAEYILEGDQVTVYGTFYQTKDYVSMLWTERTVPVLAAEYADIRR